MISYAIITSYALLSGSGVVTTLINLTLGSYLLIDDSISSLIDSPVRSSMFSKSDCVILDPNSSSNGFSPGSVKTILRTDLAIALSF